MPDITTAQLKEYGVGQVANTDIEDELAHFVKREYERNKQFKYNTGVTTRLTRNLRAKLCEYGPEDADLIKEVDVYIGLCSLKCRAAESWIIDIVSNNIDKPWTLSPTPEPDLPMELKLKVVDALIQELPQLQTFDALKDRATQYKSALQQLSSQIAATNTQRMENHIDDQLTEGRWSTVFTAFVDHLCTYPSAILRGPIEVAVKDPQWDGNKLTIKDGTALRMRVVNPFDAYPSPNSSHAGNGSNFIERIDYMPSDLHALINVPTFSGPNIRQALDDYSEGYQPETFNRSEEKVLRDKQLQFTDTQAKYDLEVLIYNGKVKGGLLAKKGVLVKDPQQYYECEIWVVGDYTIRAVLCPNPLDKRPLYSTSFVKTEGKFWGEGVIDLVYDTERTCNAAIRAIIRNMGYASGPIGEVISDRVEGEDVTAIHPYRIFRVGPDLTGTGQAAFKFHNVTAVSADIMAVFDKFYKLADDLSGVPAYILGNAQVAGAGRTLGGLSMLMGNAAKGIKNVQLNIDMDIISQCIEAYYYYNLQTSDDPSIKCDAKVVARGATGLLQRELAQSRTLELLQTILPLNVIPPPGVAFLVREALKNSGIDVDKVIPDPNAQSNLNELQGTLTGTPPGPQTGPSNTGSSQSTNLPTQSQPRSLAQQVPSTAPYPTPANFPQGAQG